MQLRQESISKQRFSPTQSSHLKQYSELKTGAQKGIARSRIEVGVDITKEAHDLFKKSDFYHAKESYRKAQDHFNKLTDFAIEQNLEEEKKQKGLKDFL